MIALIRPNISTNFFKIYSESLALGYLSAVLRRNKIETHLIDAYLEDINVEHLTDMILKNKYQIVGFTIFNAESLEYTTRCAKIIKKEMPSIHITIGGHLPSFDYEYILQRAPEIDSIVRFEGEYILLELAKAILSKKDLTTVKGLAFRDGNKVVANELTPLVTDLDVLPFPERDYLPYLINNHPDEYTVYINRGRGCYRKCTFCSVPSFFLEPKGKIIRQRSNEKLITEIENLVNEYNVNYFTFIDDVFIVPSKEGYNDTIKLAEKINKASFAIKFSISERIDTLSEEIVDALISAGLVRIFIGLEAATQNILDKLDKKISRENMENTLSWLLSKNVDVEISFINFLPINTLADIKENVIFFSQWGLDILRSVGNRLEPYPGTPFYHQLKIQGNLKRVGFSYDYRKNTTDTRVDILYEIIEPTIPYLALISHKLRSVKTLFWKNKAILANSEFLYEQLLSLQKSIVYEVRDIFMALIDELEKYEKVDKEKLKSNVTDMLSKESEWWLSCILELKNIIKHEVNNYGKAKT